MNLSHGVRRTYDLRSKLLDLVLILSALAAPCGAEQANTKETPVEVRELVDSGQKYTNRLIAVHGCYVHEFEISVLEPCGSKFDQFSKYSIWVDDIDTVTQMAQTAKQSRFIPADSAKVLKEGRGDFWKVAVSRDHPISVVLRGEFQTGVWRKYGHLNFYKHRFIVHTLIWHDGPDKRN